ncbi:hypothetical protein GCM10010052_07780 [Paenarthrobacter histidinolovorans]|nr:hypothetical protein GCM10010052_07780 [Paenarthrobacter histidinolovorans]
MVKFPTLVCVPVSVLTSHKLRLPLPWTEYTAPQLNASAAVAGPADKVSAPPVNKPATTALLAKSAKACLPPRLPLPVRGRRRAGSPAGLCICR